MTEIANGQQFTYTASLYSRVTMGADAIVTAVSNQLQNIGYTVLSNQINQPSAIGGVIDFLGTSGLNYAPFNVTLQIQSQFDGNDTDNAKKDVDGAFQTITGQSVTSSSITAVGPVPGNIFSPTTTTGQPGQVPIPSAGAFNLTGIPTWVLVIVAIIAVLVIVVVLNPGAPAGVIRSFA